MHSLNQSEGLGKSISLSGSPISLFPDEVKLDHL